MSSNRPILHLNTTFPLQKTTVQVLVVRQPKVINATELHTSKQVSLILKISVSRLRDLRWLKKGPQYIKIGKGSKAPVRYVGKDLLNYLSLEQEQ